MRVTHRDSSGTSVAVVEVDGEVDVESGPALQAQILAAGAGRSPVVIDLDAVEFFDSTGLRALDEARASLEADGGRLALSRVAPRILRLFEITGLHTQFALHPSIDDAVLAIVATGPRDDS